MQQMFFIADLIACSTCFRHHYAHHQELESIIQVVAACGICGILFPHINDDARSKSLQSQCETVQLPSRMKNHFVSIIRTDRLMLFT